jgi:O-antigen/teichoic acid export membrane protein
MSNSQGQDSVGGGLRAQLLRGGMGSLVVKASTMFSGLALTIALARILGPDGYGIYAFAFALVSVLAVPAQFGLPTLVIRETARAQAAENWGVMRGVWRWSTLVAGCLSLGLALAALVVLQTAEIHASEAQIGTFAWGLILVPFIALGNLRGAALKGLRWIIAGQLPEHVLRPGFFLAMLAYFAIFRAGDGVTPVQAMVFHTVAAATAFLIGAGLLRYAMPEQIRLKPSPVYHTRAWATAALPLALLAGMQMINLQIGVLALGQFRDSEEVGLFRVAIQGGTLVGFGLQAVNIVIAPYIARLHVQGDTRRLQRIATVGARISVAFAVPTALAFFLFGDRILNLVFGEGFGAAHAALAIVAAGQVVNAAFGSVGILLNMTGHERDSARGLSIGALVNVVLNLSLVPAFGIVGAAVASALTWVVWNTLLWKAVRTRLNINSLPL